MDPFEDILGPVAPSRQGLKFMPKAKLKQLPRKETSVSEHATSSTTFSACPQVEIPNLEDATNSETRNSQQVSAKEDTAALVDDHLHSTSAASDIDQIFTNFPKSASEADPVDFEVGSDTNIIPQTNLNTENELDNVTVPCTTCSIIDEMQEPPKNGEGSFLDSSKCLELVDNSLQVDRDVDFKSAPDNKVAIFESNIQSKSNFGREQEAVSAEFELDPFSNVLPDPGARNARKFQPKIKPRPRVGNTAANASASSNVMTEKSVEFPNSCMNEFQSNDDGSDRLNQSTSLPLPTSQILRTTDFPNKPDYMSSSIPFSEDNTGLAPVIPSQLDSLNAMLSEVAAHNGTRDWPSSFGKSSGEAADIFSGLESLDDFLTQAASDTGKPALHSFNEKRTGENFANPNCSSINSFGVCDTPQVQRCPMYQTTQDSITFNESAVLNEDDTCTTNRRLETKEVVDLNPACPDDVFDYQSMKSGTDPTSETLMHEELTNAENSPTLADFLHADVARVEDANERKKDGSMSSSSRKNKRSIIGEEDKGGKTSRQLRKQTAHKLTNSSLNEDVEDDDDLVANGDELEENSDDHEVDYSSKKRGASSSKKKSGAKNGKTSQKRKRANDDLEKTIKEPAKKFSHSTRRRKRTVDKALLEIPEDELDPRTLPIKDIILLAEHRERLAKKEGTTLKTTSTYPSDGDYLHEACANYEEEGVFGSEDGRDPDDDRANERIPSASSLFNYQSFMEKAPRGKWSKQDTELFYEAVRQFGTDFSMIQQLFPDKTRHQIKLKYKKEERQHPLRLSDAVNNRAKDHSHFKLVIERLQQASTKAEEDSSRDASDLMMGEEVMDLTPGTNEEVATTEQGADVKAQEDSASVHSPGQSDDSDDDFQKWAQYKSAY